MEAKKTGVLAAFLLMLLLASNRELPQVEARICEQPSFYYRDTCRNNRLCARACRRDGYERGQCVGALRRCYCFRHC